MSTLQFGDLAARIVSQRIAAAVATTAALTAVAAADRSDGQIAIVTADGTIWRFDASSSAVAGAKVLAPDAGTGRWIAYSFGAASPRLVRGVCYANMSLTAFVGVTGGTAQDGVTYVAGDRVLLANQTTAAENGIYIVGTVDTTAHTAPLTRASDWAAGATIANGTVIEVSEGTIFTGSSWKAMCTGAKVVATDDPLFYPRVCKGVVTLGSGIKAVGVTQGLYLFSTTTSSIHVDLDTPGGTLGTWGYRMPVADRTAGKSGTGAFTIRSTKADGTTEVSETSTVNFTVTNW